MNTNTSGTGQLAPRNMTYAKPFIPKDGHGLYGLEEYINSSLNMGNKRTPIKPDNFIGFSSLRPPNMQPNKQHYPAALNPPIQVPFMSTMSPAPKIFH